MWITIIRTTWLVVWIGLLLPQVRSSGVFELRLKSFTNDYGKDSVGRCCSGETPRLPGECSGPCKTRFRVCLKHYQALIDTTSPCTFGDVITPVLGENSLDMDKTQQEGFTNPIAFKFDFTWPGTFSLILEAWHDNNVTSRSSGGKTLISRLTTQRWLDPGDDWTEDEHKSSHSAMRYEYRVTCDAHYYGSGCANFCRPRDDQFGHYTCAPTGARVCLSGWKGAYCDQPRCLTGCSDAHGHCDKPDQCICHRGWQGKYCDECERYPGCLHGTCQKQWECLCEEGWGGLFCNQDLNYCTNHKPCHNGGVCFNTGQGSYTCRCQPGFTGADCEQALDGCSTKNPCENGGSCRNSDAGRFTCDCPKGFLGDRCEMSTVSCRETKCKNGGACVDSALGFKCRCSPGFAGTHCEDEVDECSPSPCLNGGTCNDLRNGFKCTCAPGFTGQRCDVNINDCVNVSCQNGGTCVDLVSGHRCQCVPGYVGPECQSKVDYCITKPCANGATCRNLVNDYQCMCRPGFRGKDCSIDVDECSSSPCKNGGTCLNRVNNFECRCPEGLTGRVCETEGGVATANMLWQTGNMSKHISERTEESGLSTEHVVVIATFSTAVPVLVLVSAVVVICMKQRRKREQQKADEEARLQNEQNTVHSSMSKRGVVGGPGDAHMIKNTWGKSVNNVDRSESVAVSPSSESCCGKATPDSVYSLLRTRSHKTLNTDTAVHRQSMPAVPQRPSSKMDKEVDPSTGLCRPDQRVSVLSVDSSLCNTSDSLLVKRPFEKDGLSSSPSSVFIIGGPGTLATEV